MFFVITEAFFYFPLFEILIFDTIPVSWIF